MRKTFVGKLLSLADRHPELMVATGDLGYAVFEPFIAKFPDQYINCGVAEQDLMGMSAGLAMEGKTVFAYSITPFATIRPLEQIRMDICYHKLPVRVVGSGAGLSYGTLGPSHHGTEDLALMRAMPNMVVSAPADRHELAVLMELALTYKGPMYLRIGRSSEPDVHAFEPKLEIGKGIIVSDAGPDFALISCGNMVWTALEAAKRLQAMGKKGIVISMPFVKPLDEKMVLDFGGRMPVFTLEEHSIIGGLGSAVAEALMDGDVRPPAFERIALPDDFQHKVGKHDFLRRVNGLTPEAVAKKIESKLGARKP